LTNNVKFDKICKAGGIMREKVILVCEECLSRNYTTEKNKLNTTERVVIKKFCKKCNKHTVHKETK
jgi:large subunit ribosomal protein L33